MINNVGIISGANALTASAATGAQKEWIPVSETVSVATDIYTAGASQPRVGQSEYDSLFENLGRNFSGHAEGSTGGIFSPQIVDIERDYKTGALERETAWIYNSSWFGLVQELDQSITSRQTPDGIEKTVTDYNNKGNAECQTVFINDEYYSRTDYGAYGPNEDATYYANGNLDVRTKDDNGDTVKMENYGPWEVDGRKKISEAEYEYNENLGRNTLAGRTTYYDDGSIRSASRYATTAEGIPKAIKEEVFRPDGTLELSFEDYQNGRTKYKEFDVDGETVIHEYPPSSNGN